MSWTAGEQRADRIIQTEMMRCDSEMKHARTFEAWALAHRELQELGKVADAVHGKRLEIRKELTASLFD
jgi:hypothetical protein